MRGKIIHYNTNDGKGLVAAEGKQFPFEISLWGSETAPGTNQVVDMQIDDEKLVRLERVSDNALLKEAASGLAGKVGAMGTQLGSNLEASGAMEMSGNFFAKLGKPVLIAYAAFLIGAIAFNYVSINVMGIVTKGVTLFGLSDLPLGGGNSKGVAILALLSFLVPLLWRNRLAWLALLLPLIATAYPILAIANDARKSSARMSGMMGDRYASQMMEQVWNSVSLGLGFWMCLAAGVMLAVVALKRTLIGNN